MHICLIPFHIVLFWDVSFLYYFQSLIPFHLILYFFLRDLFITKPSKCHYHHLFPHSDSIRSSTFWCGFQSQFGLSIIILFLASAPSASSSWFIIYDNISACFFLINTWTFSHCIQPFFCCTLIIIKSAFLSCFVLVRSRFNVLH